MLALFVAAVPAPLWAFPRSPTFSIPRGEWWRLEDHRLGRTWNPVFDDSLPAPLAHCGSPVRPEHCLCRQRRRIASARPVRWRRHLQVHRRRQDLDASWPPRWPADLDMAVDPRDPNQLFVAVAGHPYGPNTERGIYRSTDGGQTFQDVLQKDENVGAASGIDPSRPKYRLCHIVGGARRPVGERRIQRHERRYIQVYRRGQELAASSRGGLPSSIIQAYVTIARSDPKQLFAVVAIKGGVEFYRSADAGATWSTVTSDPRPRMRIGGGDLPIAAIDPKNPAVVYVTSTVTWKSGDGGKTWTGFRGAPGGDDYQNIWINPNDPKTIIMGSDQGAIITVNGGRHGARGTTSRRRSSTTLTRTTLSPIACAAGSRRAAQFALPAAAMTARSPSATGIPLRRKNMATWCPIRSTLTSSMAASSRAMTGARRRRRTSCRCRWASPGLSRDPHRAHRVLAVRSAPHVLCR